MQEPMAIHFYLPPKLPDRAAPRLLRYTARREFAYAERLTKAVLDD
jgi:hypothetical protein